MGQEDFLVEKTKGARGLHHAELLVKYVLVVNEEVTPEDLSEALEPMGTEAQNIPKPYALRMREEGRQEGRQESQLEIARRLLAEGMSPAKVADLTDLPLEEVQALSH